MDGISELIQRRKSPLAFTKELLTEEVAQELLEAARWAPSSYNEQPWRFIYSLSQHTEEYGRLLECINPGNQRWAKHAVLLMLTVARTHFAHNQKPNPHAWHDVGTATGFIFIKATSLNLGVHAIAGFSAEKAKTLFNISEGYEAVAMLAIGTPGINEDLPDDLKIRDSRPRQRKDLAEIGFRGEWREKS